MNRVNIAIIPYQTNGMIRPAKYKFLITYPILQSFVVGPGHP